MCETVNLLQYLNHFSNVTRDIKWWPTTGNNHALNRNRLTRPASCWTGTGEVQICLGLQDQGIEGTVKLQGKVGSLKGVVVDTKKNWTDPAKL